VTSPDDRAAFRHGFERRLVEYNEPEQELPKFKSIPSDLVTHPFSLKGRSGVTPHSELWEAFTPSKPKNSSRFFAGRHWAIQRVITAIEEDQAHIVIYGPRGIGKTSLSNVLAEAAGEADYEVLRYPCSSGTTFEEIFRGLLRSLPSDFMDRATQARFRDVENLGQLLPPGEFGPTELTETLNQLKLEHAIMIIDEFDRAESSELKTQLAEAIKNLSDASARVTFIIVGIARSLEELIGMHPSIQRNLVGVHLPLMEPSELQQVILAGEEASGTRFDDDARDMIVSFSKGLPYHAQLLALHAGRVALERRSSTVEMADLRAAVGKVLKEADPLAKASYEIAAKDESNLFVVDVLYAAAAAAFDSYGSFSVSDIAKVTVDENGKTIPEITLVKALDELSQKKNAQIFDKWKTPTARTRYNFVLQTMRQYILLRQATRRGLM
jgi:Cdc6-like AAA superfamily ATPase